LRTRILPTINMSKIDEMYSRINELASMKMNLEMQNKKLRDENHELASNKASYKCYITAFKFTIIMF